jgi:hypothetical protein
LTESERCNRLHPYEPFIEQAIALSQAAVTNGNHRIDSSEILLCADFRPKKGT